MLVDSYSYWHWLVLSVLLAGLVGIWCYRHPHWRTATSTANVQRLLKPRTPADCPACRQQTAAPAGTVPPRSPVTPWSAVKSRRGAMGRIDTHAFACPTPTCVYYQITDAQIHALVGDGREGRREHRETLRCQACGATFSSRRGYPLGDPALSPQNGISTRRRSADGVVGRTGCCCGRAGVRPPPCHHYHLADPGRHAQRDAARPLLPGPPPAACATRRIAHSAAESCSHAVAVGGS
jgi:hypothetical protein